MEYLSNEARRLTARVITNPTVQTAADLYLTAKDYLGPEATAVLSLAAALYGPDMADFVHLVGTVADPGITTFEAEQYVQSVTQPVIDPAIDMAVDAFDSFAMAGRKEAEYQRAEQELRELDPQKAEADRQEAAKLEAQWAAQRQADEQDSLSRQQQAENKGADALEQALRKDQEFLQQAQADQAARDKTAEEKPAAGTAIGGPEVEAQTAEIKALQAAHDGQLKQLDQARNFALEDRAQKDAAFAESHFHGKDLDAGTLKTLEDAQAANQQQIKDRFAVEETDLRQRQGAEMAALQAKQMAEQHREAPPPPPPLPPPPPPSPPTRSL